MSLFISGLAFDDAALEQEAKVGILAGSLLAASVGALILGTGRSSGKRPQPAQAAA
jgi:NhaA family Na+:H+ antiporter